jgi:hypothetical protein
VNCLELFGACLSFVLKALETPKELQKCDAARKNVLDKVDMLGTSLNDIQFNILASEK